jgi:hypothetical protein
MLISRIMQGLTCSSLIITFLVTIAGQSAIAQSPTRDTQMGIKNLQISRIKIAQAPSIIDEKAAFDLVWQLPQVKRKVREIERLSKGKIRVSALLDSQPTPETPFYIIRVVENHRDHIDTIYLFRVNPNGVIQVYDILQDDYIALQEWKPN